MPEATAPAPAPQAAVPATETLHLVRNGVATSAIVLPQDEDASVRTAAEAFARQVKRSTGAAIPLLSSAEAAQLPEGTVRLFVGPHLPELRNLPPETYRILTKGNALYVAGAKDGNDTRANFGVASRPTLWGLNHLLEQSLGVRWLWPGELGTYSPRHTEMAIAPCDITYQPRLESRTLRLLLSRKRRLIAADPQEDARLSAEAVRWAENHHNGSRSEVTFGHNFTHWWERYSKDHPDYFAELPPPHQQPFPKPGAAKLRLANPAVIEQIAKEYQDAGAPKYWNVCPNDGSGFDISEETRAWDEPKDQPIGEIFAARGKLTARYVRFWNRLYERLKEINPELVLVSYAYSSYKDAPKDTYPLTAPMVLQIVDRVDAFENWKGWAKYAKGLYLRPNWWHQGADAPYLPLEHTAKFLQFGYAHQMKGLDMDSVLGYWATQGPNYYLVARMLTRPEITVEEVLQEYTSAFGAGAAKIREYLAYWEKLTLEYNYAINADGGEERNASRYEALVRAGKVPRSILNGSKYVLPYLYTDEVIAPAEQLLDQAQAAIGSSDEEALQRVAFLRKGLESMRATREQVVRGRVLRNLPTPERVQAFEEGIKDLEARRAEWAKEHVIWAEATRTYEERYHILLRPSALEFNKINLDGY